MQTRSKLNSTERTISKALIDNEISYKGYTAIMKKKTKSNYYNVEKTKKQYRKK